MVRAVGRDPATIERTVAVDPDDVHDVGRYLEDGATHVIVTVGSPFDVSSPESLITQREVINT